MTRSAAKLPHVQRGAPVRSPAPGLPQQLSSLVGRQSELEQLADVLQSARLVTLIGTGGVGKTRLAVAAASTVAQAYADGVRFASLAALDDPAFVEQTVAAAFDVRERGGQSALTILSQTLRESCVLLVLDNCEHLIEACADLIEALLQSCPTLTILATSRERLGVAGEVTWRVPSLSVPPSLPTPSVQQLSQYEAVQLFVNRAMSIEPDFTLSSANSDSVAEVCRRLDGIPLAIELAAAWMHTLSVEELRSRLDDRFHLLVGGSRIAPPRQRTLRGSIEWSYELLPMLERRLFAALGVFAGGWTLEAAEAVCSDEQLPSGEILCALRQLVDKSLVVTTQTVDGTRYHMLETLRDFALEQAHMANDLAQLERRHLQWYLALAEAVLPHEPSAEQIERVAQEQDNLRAALGRGLKRGDVDLALRLGVAMYYFWYTRGLYSEGHAWLTELLAIPGASAPTISCAKALAWAGHLASLVGMLSEARTLLDEGLRVAEHVGDALAQSMCWQILGSLARRQGGLRQAKVTYERSLALAREANNSIQEAWAAYLIAFAWYELGDSDAVRLAIAHEVEASTAAKIPRVWARVLRLKAWLATLDGDNTSAKGFEEESLALLHQLGDQQGLAFGHLEAARRALDRGESGRAATHLSATLTSGRDTGDQLAVTQGLEGVGQLLTTVAPSRAVHLLAVADSTRKTYGLARTPPDEARLETWLASIRRQLSTDAYSRAREAGKRDSLARAIEMALDSVELTKATPGESDEDASKLTAREKQVALLLVRGLSNRDVALTLTISEGTARIHTERILGKLGLRSRVQVADWARTHGLLPQE
jgi:non-specific serine/threonine protein kinase